MNGSESFISGHVILFFQMPAGQTIELQALILELPGIADFKKQLTDTGFIFHPLHLPPLPVSYLLLSNDGDNPADLRFCLCWCSFGRSASDEDGLDSYAARRSTLLYPLLLCI